MTKRQILSAFNSLLEVFMINYVEQCIIAFIPCILPLIGMRLIFDYTRLSLFRD